MIAFSVNVDVRPNYDAKAIAADVSSGQNHKISELGWKPKYSLQDSISKMVNSIR